MIGELRPIDNKKVIGRGTWYDKAADELIKREKKLKRSLDNLRTESGLGASGYPHIGSIGDAKTDHIAGIVVPGEALEKLAVAWLANRWDGTCPKCGGHSSETGGVYTDGTFAFQDCTCESCGKVWTDKYVICDQLVGTRRP